MTPSSEISVVIPFYNEADNVADVLGEVLTVLVATGRSFELMLVDDGSTDGTAAILMQMAAHEPACRILQHARHAGQAGALWSGLQAARGAIVVTLDGDGQNDPADLPSMIACLAHADLVVGVRKSRQDSWLRRRMSGVANAVRRRYLRDGAHDAGCGLRVFRREVVASFMPILTLYSFIPAFASAAGYRVVEHPVAHRPRRFGSSSYGLRVMWWRPLLDMLALGWLGRRRVDAPPVRELRASLAGTPPRSTSHDASE